VTQSYLSSERKSEILVMVAAGLFIKEITRVKEIELCALLGLNQIVAWLQMQTSTYCLIIIKAKRSQ
jgi:hypothetical protein